MSFSDYIRQQMGLTKFSSTIANEECNEQQKAQTKGDSRNEPKTYNIHIDGEEIADNLPNQNGVYFVLNTRHSSKRNQTIQYIGQANREKGGIADRAEEHKEEGYPKNMKYAYSILDKGNYTDEDYFRIEYALIFALNPDWNKNGDKHYNYGKTTINISGNCPWIRYKKFTIENDTITEN